MCYCAALPRIDTTTRVVILQHPRERDMPIGTARMASLCLPQAELHVGIRWDGSAPLARALGDPERPPILLYPGPGARDILRDPPPGPVTLVMVDGTWSQAKTVVRDNPVLQALPRYAFAPPEPSQYRIRREPRAEYVSTIEALMHVLGALEGEPARFRSLLAPLHRMVDAQLACQGLSPRRCQRQPRAPRRRIPEVFTRRFDDLVCVVGEANAWPYRAGAASPPEELVHWVARRVATGQTFDVIARPERALSPSTAFHIELPEDDLRRGVARAELFARFAAFLRPTDLLCAWGPHSYQLAIGSGGGGGGGAEGWRVSWPEGWPVNWPVNWPKGGAEGWPVNPGGGAVNWPVAWIDLRALAHRIAQRKLGSLETYAATLPRTPAPEPAAPHPPGRAGRRLALLVDIVRAWHALACAPGTLAQTLAQRR